jgi:hypothetical protein
MVGDGSRGLGDAQQMPGFGGADPFGFPFAGPPNQGGLEQLVCHMRISIGTLTSPSFFPGFGPPPIGGGGRTVGGRDRPDDVLGGQDLVRESLSIRRKSWLTLFLFSWRL